MKIKDIQPDTEYAVVSGSKWKSGEGSADMLTTGDTIEAVQTDTRTGAMYFGNHNGVIGMIERNGWDGRKLREERVIAAQIRCTWAEWLVLEAEYEARLDEIFAARRRTTNMNMAWQERASIVGLTYQYHDRKLELSGADAEFLLGALEDGTLVLPSTVKVTT